MSGHHTEVDKCYEVGRDLSIQYSTILRQICSSCGYQSNSVSNLRKHSLRHEKSHKCDVPRCPRGDRGFGTVNDLERHKKSKHGIKPKHGAAKSYRCASKQCEWAPKIWPRLDNFKQHVKRVHKYEDMQQLIAMSEHVETSATPVDQANELKCLTSTTTPAFTTTNTNGFGGQTTEIQPTAQIKAEQIDSDVDFSLFEIEHTEPVRNLEGQSQIMDVKQEISGSVDNSVVGSPTISTSSSETVMAPIERHTSTEDPLLKHLTQLPSDLISHCSYDLDVLTDQCNHHGMSTHKHLLASTTITSSIPEIKERTKEPAHSLNKLSESEHQSSSLPLRRFPVLKHEVSYDYQWPKIPSQVSTRNYALAPSKKGAMYSMMPYLESLSARKSILSSKERALINKDTAGYLPPQEFTIPETHSITNGSTNIAHGLPPSLNNIFSTSSRRKQQSDQPFTQYGCTFPGCYRVFKSRKHWRRHESGQHFQLESWRCHLPRSKVNRQKCAKVFFKAEGFRNHIHEHHELRESQKLATEHWKGRIGRNGQGSFWCGFCKEILQLRERAIAAWEERFRHIEGHFAAGDSISTWLCIFTNISKRDILLRRMSDGNLRRLISESTAVDLILDHERNHKDHFVKFEKESSGDVVSVEESNWPE